MSVLFVLNSTTQGAKFAYRCYVLSLTEVQILESEYRDRRSASFIRAVSKVDGVPGEDRREYTYFSGGAYLHTLPNCPLLKRGGVGFVIKPVAPIDDDGPMFCHLDE